MVIEKKRLLWLSDSPLTCTGYGSISMNLLNYLSSKDYECQHMGHNYVGQTLPPGLTFQDGYKLNYTLSGAGMAAYCQDLIMPRIKEFQPHFMGILLDTFMCFPWLLNLDFAPALSFFYFPSDGGGGLPQNCELILQKMNFNVAMSKFAQKQAYENYGIKTHFIPPGVRNDLFFPLPNKEELKARWGLKDRFIFGTVARNQGRKMLDRTIKAFAVFCQKNPTNNAILFMHTDPLDVATVFNINLLIQRHKLQNRVIFSGMRYFKGFDYLKMNEIYNLMDVFILTTTGEGWGIPIIEAMACEIPCIVTNYTTTYEILREGGTCGLPVAICADVTGSWTVERGIMDINDCVAQMETYYYSPELREKHGKVGRKKALEIYDWNIIGDSWDKLFQKEGIQI